MPLIIAIRASWLPALAALLLATDSAAAAADTGVAAQRRIFQAVYASAERGDWSAIGDLTDQEQRALERYVLWPDLRAAYLRARLAKAGRREISEFLDSYGSLRPGRELRYRYAMALARRGDLDGYYEIYKTHYQGLGNPALDCLALQAALAAGEGQRIAARARRLWLIGRSQADECDPVFDFLKSAGLLTRDDYLERYALAIEAREFRLARWLGKSIDEAHVDRAEHWISAQSDPEKFMRSKAMARDSETLRAQLAHAAQQLGFRDASLAHDVWSGIRAGFAFSEQQAGNVERHIALWTARDNLDGAYALLEALPSEVADDEVMRWRARTSLRAEAWLRLIADVSAMSAGEQTAEEWRFWRAVALDEIGQLNAARSGLEQLAGERSYYGFLAADRLRKPYAFDHSELDVDAAAVDALARQPALVRARELFLVGLDGRGRSEWDAVVESFSPEQKIHAAVLADRWGWHSRAIAAVASGGHYDDLTLRYPLPYKSDFERYSSSARIAVTWAYGVARSESLFMRDVRSSAGAIGLMQLKPSTGRSIARELNLTYSGLETLTDPIASIRLGTTYLGKMADRYGGNRAAATAAYNAGPHRVDRWLPDQQPIDTRIWIENIPYNETRAYVRRVLAAEAIFHWRINGTLQRLNDALPFVTSSPGPELVASASR